MGIAILLFGRKFLSLLVALAFFVISTKICAEIPEATNYTFLISLIAAVVGFALSRATEKLAFFLLGFAAGYFIANCLLAFVDVNMIDYNIQTIIEVIVGVIFGLLCSIQSATFVELFTAIFGATILADAITYLIYEFSNLSTLLSNSASVASSFNNIATAISQTAKAHSTIVLILTVVLTIFGFYFQKKH